MQVVPNDTYSMTLYRLQPQTIYQFTILSRNQNGHELFSQTVTTTTLRMASSIRIIISISFTVTVVTIIIGVDF